MSVHARRLGLSTQRRSARHHRAASFGATEYRRLPILRACVIACSCSCSGPALTEQQTTSSEDPIKVADLPIKPTQKAIAGAFVQPFDHDDTHLVGAFLQRYWYSTEFAENENSPVLLYVCGEWACSAREGLYNLADSGRLLKASIVVLEHRYYGESQLAPTYTLDDMKYLSIHQALEDMAAFQRFAMEQLPLKGKWVAVGGSYAGMLAAYYREKHPELCGRRVKSSPLRRRS